MFRIRNFVCLYVLFALAATLASAQVQTGTPPFGSFGGGPDVVNLASLNTHFAFPVLHKPGRGVPFDYALSYDTLLWTPVGATGSQVWQAASNWGWAVQTAASIGYVPAGP